MEIGKIVNNKVEKEFFRQGHIYKNTDNFEKKSGICYIAEYQCDYDVLDNESVEGRDYETYDSMKEQVDKAYKMYNIDETKYRKETMLATVFEMVDWQFFSTLLYEVIDSLDDEYFLKEDDKNDIKC